LLRALLFTVQWSYSLAMLEDTQYDLSTEAGSQGSVLLQRGAAGGDNCSAEGEGNSVDGAGSSVEDDIEVMWQEVSVQRDSPSLPGCMTPNGAAIGWVGGGNLKTTILLSLHCEANKTRSMLHISLKLEPLSLIKPSVYH
jgi:hypothetical protein